ncbi:hypothetical protein roselon_01791 [Roseibacterium elongatum DSM 19469]|uniref:Uncharacterized protein n=1 Tax=Roseicyclus elongatus DSM 19469 TaxID=1294273 RepID=W8S1V0_9RHOB|nr:hypothetical protein [Roseibacterium elongatum]AHM04157.1 hypothetical protein roselon_01791 [Roseibacterium elongatum DSM 19469]
MRRFQPKSLAILVALVGLSTAANAASGVGATGYTVERTTPEGGLRVLHDGVPVWRLPPDPGRFQLYVSGASDHTGDTIPELIVVERTSRSFGTVYVLSLFPDRVEEILTESAFHTALRGFEHLAPGAPLSEAMQMLDGPDGIDFVPEPPLRD